MNVVQEAGQRIETTERRQRLREALVAAAERAIDADGLGGLKARSLAQEVGCALGAIYNVFADLDALVLAVNARTLDRLDEAIRYRGPEPGSTGEGTDSGGVRGGPYEADAAAAAIDRLVALGETYLGFAAAQPHLWRALFEHRLPPGTEVPDWYQEQKARIFAHLDRPLRVLLPGASKEDLDEAARVLFSAVHGIVTLGLEEKLGALSIDALRLQVRRLVTAFCRGL